LGSDVTSMLFENNTPEVVSQLEEFIENTIKNNEPRVNLLQTIVNDNSLDSNSVEITLIYNLINNPEEITLTILLKRVR
jgi:phage baseplate assembly protein W